MHRAADERGVAQQLLVERDRRRARDRWPDAGSPPWTAIIEGAQQKEKAINYSPELNELFMKRQRSRREVI